MGTFQDILRSGKPIHIAVDYYNPNHKALLSAYPNGAAIDGIVGNTVAIPAPEFLSYCLFVNKRDTGIGLNSYSAIKNGLNDRMGDFNDGLALTPTSLRTIRTGNDQIAGLSEKIGVGMALSVVSRLHGLTEADWERIPIGSSKSLDFRRACDDVGYVQVEAKGTSIPDNSGPKTTGISNFAKDIGEKKDEVRAKGYPVTVYGTIGTIDTRQDSVMKCWLLDPPGVPSYRDPREQRILNRLFFIAELMEAIFPQSPMTVDLYKRLAILVSAEKMYEYDKHPLSVHKSNIDHAIFTRKTHTIDKSVLGVVVPIRDGSRLFFGVQRKLLDAAYKQDFGALLDLSWSSTTDKETLTGIDFVEEDQADTANKDRSADGKKKQRHELAVLQIASSGRVFGLIGN